MFTYYRFNSLRVLLAMEGFAAVLFAPWWAVLGCVFLLCLRFQAWEVMLIGIFMDLYWSPMSLGVPETIPLATIACIVLLFGLEPLRRQLLVGPEIL